ncbi:MAG: DMT family transporter [Actinomycetota bacterium]
MPNTPTDTELPERKLFQQGAAVNDGVFTPGDWGLFLSVALIWGSSFLLIDIGLDAFPPGFITLLRVGSGAVALSALLMRPGRPTARVSERIEPSDRARVLVLSIIWVAVPFTFFPLAQDHINSSVTGLLNGATPIFAAAVAALLFRQWPRGPLAVGIAVGFAGITLISLPSIGDGSSQAFGVGLVLAATVCYGFALNLAGPLQQRYGSLPLMARVLTLATLWTAPFGLWELGDADWQIGPLVAVLGLGVVGTGIAFAIMGSLVGRVGSTRASFITYLIPVVSLTLGITFRGDEVAPLAIVGIALVIGGALLASRAKR